MPLQSPAARIRLSQPLPSADAHSAIDPAMLPTFLFKMAKMRTISGDYFEFFPAWLMLRKARHRLLSPSGPEVEGATEHRLRLLLADIDADSPSTGKGAPRA